MWTLQLLNKKLHFSGAEMFSAEGGHVGSCGGSVNDQVDESAL